MVVARERAMASGKPERTDLYGHPGPEPAPRIDVVVPLKRSRSWSNAPGALPCCGDAFADSRDHADERCAPGNDRAQLECRNRRLHRQAPSRAKGFAKLAPFVR